MSELQQIMMNARQIFEAALDINESEMRSAYLDSACKNNTALRTRVEALLSSHECQSQFLKVPALEQMNYIERQGDQNEVLQEVASDQDDDSLTPDLSFLGPSSKADSIGTKYFRFWGKERSGSCLKPLMRSYKEWWRSK
jgi:hypothetical protein